jgi:hypothetical protein
MAHTATWEDNRLLITIEAGTLFPLNLKFTPPVGEMVRIESFIHS